MTQTYELYLERAGREPQFMALTCTPAELLERVRLILANDGASRAEIRQFGETLYMLAAAREEKESH